MKVILSRKGFDSSWGGFPSIILPKEMGRKMISFPIPVTSPEIGIKAEDIYYVEAGKTLKDFFNELPIEQEKKYINNKTGFHVDPEVQNIKIDNQKSFIERGYGTLGQCSAAAGHLANNGISAGGISEKDPAIFLFFGWFCKTEIENDKIKYIGNPLVDGFHAIWGYLIAVEAIEILDISKHPELKEHLHYRNKNHKEYKKGDKNTIFIGNKFGTFNYSDNLRLTYFDDKKTKNRRTIWAIPSFISEMTYNNKRIKEGKTKGNKLIIDAASRGQEFVITKADEEEMKKWLDNLGVNF